MPYFFKLSDFIPSVEITDNGYTEVKRKIDTTANNGILIKAIVDFMTTGCPAKFVDRPLNERPTGVRILLYDIPDIRKHPEKVHEYYTDVTISRLNLIARSIKTLQPSHIDPGWHYKLTDDGTRILKDILNIFYKIIKTSKLPPIPERSLFATREISFENAYIHVTCNDAVVYESILRYGLLGTDDYNHHMQNSPPEIRRIIERVGDTQADPPLHDMPDASDSDSDGSDESYASDIYDSDDEYDSEDEDDAMDEEDSDEAMDEDDSSEDDEEDKEYGGARYSKKSKPMKSRVYSKKSKPMKSRVYSKKSKPMKSRLYSKKTKPMKSRLYSKKTKPMKSRVYSKKTKKNHTLRKKHIKTKPVYKFENK